MQPDLQYVPTRRLIAEIGARVPRLIRRQVRGAGRHRGARVAGEPFGVWAIRGRDVRLFADYRRSIKGWTRYFWQSDVLVRLDARAPLSPPMRDLAAQLRSARTLPVSLDEIAAELDRACPGHPNVVARVTAGEESRWEMVPEDAGIRALAAAYRSHGERVLRALGVPARQRAATAALEVGCGTGYGTMAMAALGVNATGVDLDLEACAGLAEHERVRRELLPSADARGRAVFQRADAHSLPFADGTFDVVHHASVLEHIQNPAVALAEMARVLRPGGLAWIEVDPWFSPAGGHMLCTLDFPWGHARLEPEAFEAYVRTHRPYEADAAIGFYTQGFQRPRLSIAATEAAVVHAGFRIVDWQESRARFANHYEQLDGDVLEDCRAAGGDPAVRDLLTDSFSMVLRKS